MPMPENHLFDEVNAWSFTRGKNVNVSFAPHADEELIQRHMLNYRKLVRKARRFFIDNDFLDTAIQGMRSRDVSGSAN